MRPLVLLIITLLNDVFKPRIKAIFMQKTV